MDRGKNLLSRCKGFKLPPVSSYPPVIWNRFETTPSSNFYFIFFLFFFILTHIVRLFCIIFVCINLLNSEGVVRVAWPKDCDGMILIWFVIVLIRSIWILRKYINKTFSTRNVYLWNWNKHTQSSEHTGLVSHLNGPSVYTTRATPFLGLND